VWRRLREQLRPLHKLCGRLGAVFPHQWFLGFHNHKAFHRSYWSLYSHKILYIIIWHVVSKSLHIYTYRDTGITEMDSARGSTYLWDPGVDRHHLIIQNTHSIFPSSSSHALMPSFVDLCNLCGSSRTVVKHSYIHAICVVQHGRGSLHILWPSSKLRDALGGRNRASLEIHLEAVTERGWRCIWMPWRSEFRDTHEGCDWASSEMHWDAVIERGWRCTWRTWSCEFGDALGGHDRANLDSVIGRL